MRDFLSRAINNVWSSGIGLSDMGQDSRSVANLIAEGNLLASRTPLDKTNTEDFVLALMQQVCERHGRDPHESVKISLCIALDRLLYLEGILPVEIDRHLLKTSFSYKDDLKALLDSRINFYRSYETNINAWFEQVVSIFDEILSSFPDHAFRDKLDGPQFPVRLTEMAENLPKVLDRILVAYGDSDFRHRNLSRIMHEALMHNTLRASGIESRSRNGSTKAVIVPSEAKEPPDQLISAYLGGTPYEEFFSQSLPFAIPEAARFEHCMITGGTGHGKTQLLQKLIFADLERAQRERRSIVVIDSQGDLIRKLCHLRVFDRDAEDSLFGKFCLIDPSEIEYPVALNMFAVNRERLKRYGKAEREKVLNGTVELYENFFGSLLGAELTQKQGVIFKYLARLMLEIPDANIHTLRDLMDDAEPYIPYMEKLTGSARYFFEREFFDRSFAPTKKQITKRLWGVLATPSFERMFAQKENKIDMFDLLNSGRVILINTAKDLLKQEGCQLFGRFFLSLITQAAMERSVINEKDRTPTTIYVDEAAEYFDDSIDILLAQGRKYKMAIVCGNQTLDQATPSLRASLMSNTGTKVVGGLSAKDANAFASEMRCDSDFLQSLKKRKDSTEFGLYVRNHTPQAVRIEVPLGFLEKQDRQSEYSYQRLLDENRTKFATKFVEEAEAGRPFARPKQENARKSDVIEAKEPSISQSEEILPPAVLQAPVPPSHQQQEPRHQPQAEPAEARPSKMPVKPGRGGREHKYLQELVKGLAEQHGYLARIEEEVLAGDGFVDVSLTRGEERIACEIALTTPVERELGNIVKCLDAGFGLVWVISPEHRHLTAIRRLAEESLSAEQIVLVSFLKPDDVPGILDSKGILPKESVVRGYKVRIRRSTYDQHQDQSRREIVGELLARNVSGEPTEDS